MKWTMRPLMMHEQDSDLPPEGYEVVDEAGQPVFDNQTYYPGPPTPEQAAHIVHCVSNHNALVAALEVMAGLCVIKYGNLDPDVWAEIQKAKGVIEAAKGIQP